mmetsp:Transcript_12675/g.34603  ORF Transcript_12675/g.34603 Transcript_12675/m.34603 type:complete len:256 (-) Transcript_12675:121-888(-)
MLLGSKGGGGGRRVHHSLVIILCGLVARVSKCTHYAPSAVQQSCGVLLGTEAGALERPMQVRHTMRDRRAARLRCVVSGLVVGAIGWDAGGVLQGVWAAAVLRLLHSHPLLLVLPAELPGEVAAALAPAPLCLVAAARAPPHPMKQGGLSGLVEMAAPAAPAPLCVWATLLVWSSRCRQIRGLCWLSLPAPFSLLCLPGPSAALLARPTGHLQLQVPSRPAGWRSGIAPFPGQFPVCSHPTPLPGPLPWMIQMYL